MEYRIPQYLHRPPQLFWFEGDVIVAAMAGYFIGFFLGGWWNLAIILVPYAYMRIRARVPRGFLLHLQYMVGLLNLQGYPHYFQSKFRS